MGGGVEGDSSACRADLPAKSCVSSIMQRVSVEKALIFTGKSR